MYASNENLCYLLDTPFAICKVIQVELSTCCEGGCNNWKWLLATKWRIRATVQYMLTSKWITKP